MRWLGVLFLFCGACEPLAGVAEETRPQEAPCTIELQVLDGMEGKTPSHADQVTRGAFTVLNANDHAAGRLYVIDAPGLHSAAAHGRDQGYVMRFNAHEWVRVRFDGKRPAGNKVDGTRASAKVAWHARHRLVAVDNAWTRSTGDAAETETNDVDLGHIAILPGP